MTLLRSHGIEAERRTERIDVTTAAPPTAAFEVYIAHLRTGFRSAARGVALVTDHELLGRTRRASSAKSAEEAITLSSFKDLNIEDLVVHVDFGVARYLGMQRMVLGDGIDTEFLIVPLSLALTPVENV